MFNDNRKLVLIAAILALVAFVTGFAAVTGSAPQKHAALVEPATPAPKATRHTGELKNVVADVEATERPLTQDPTTSYIARQVFMVRPITPNGMVMSGGGTAFLANDQGGLGKIIVTNKHICESRLFEEDEPSTYFLLSQGKLTYVAKIIAMSNDTDLCVIEAPFEVKAHGSGLFLAPAEVAPYTKVSVYGHPFLRPLTRTDGVALNVMVDVVSSEDPRPMRIGAIDFIINPGNSGSPLLNQAGNVVGVIFAFDTRRYNGLFIPLDDLKRFLRAQALEREAREIAQ